MSRQISLKSALPTSAKSAHTKFCRRNRLRKSKLPTFPEQAACALSLLLCWVGGGRGWTERSEGSPGVSSEGSPTPATLKQNVGKKSSKIRDFSTTGGLRLTFVSTLLNCTTTLLIACFQQNRTFWLMGRTERQREIARRRKRKVGLAKVRARHAASKNEAEKALLLAKARRMSPFITLD